MSLRRRREDKDGKGAKDGDGNRDGRLDMDGKRRNWKEWESENAQTIPHTCIINNIN